MSTICQLLWYLQEKHGIKIYVEILWKLRNYKYIQTGMEYYNFEDNKLLGQF